MSLWTRLVSSEPEPDYSRPHAARGGQTLPGIAGYQGTKQLPKNAMPVVRFKYVRPDGRG